MEPSKLMLQKEPIQLRYPKLKPIPLDKLLIKSRSAIQFIPLTSISYLKFSNNYCEIFYEGGRKVISSKTLGSYESKLSVNFIRIHNGCIVNTGHIAKIDLRGNRVTMENGDNLTISRSRKQKFLNTFNKYDK